MVYFSQVVLRQLSRDEFLEFKNQTKLRQGYIQGRRVQLNDFGGNGGNYATLSSVDPKKEKG